MILPNVVRILLDEYGFQGAALIMGALAFHGLIGASLFQPVDWHMKRMSFYSEKNRPNEQVYHEVRATDAKFVDDYDSRNILASDTISIDSRTVLFGKRTWKQRIFKALDLDLLFDLQFVSIATGLSLGAWAKATTYII